MEYYSTFHLNDCSSMGLTVVLYYKEQYMATPTDRPEALAAIY